MHFVSEVRIIKDNNYTLYFILYLLTSRSLILNLESRVVGLNEDVFIGLCVHFPCRQTLVLFSTYFYINVRSKCQNWLSFHIQTSTNSSTSTLQRSTLFQFLTVIVSWTSSEPIQFIGSFMYTRPTYTLRVWSCIYKIGVFKISSWHNGWSYSRKWFRKYRMFSKLHSPRSFYSRLGWYCWPTGCRVHDKSSKTNVSCHNLILGI